MGAPGTVEKGGRAERRLAWNDRLRAYPSHYSTMKCNKRFHYFMLYCSECSQSTPQEKSSMERTLVLLKPDAVQRGLLGEIVSRFERKGLKIVGMKMMRLTDALLDEHYAHL